MSKANLLGRLFSRTARIFYKGNCSGLKKSQRRHEARRAAIFELLENRLVLSAPPLPTIPTGSGHLFIVTASPFNAKGDGTTNNTSAIQAAINAASAAGGGVVEIPTASAAYECGALTMASNVDLQIDSGAILQAIHGLSGSTWIAVTNVNNWEITGLGSGSSMGTLDGGAAGSTGSLNMITLNGATLGLIQNVQVNNSPHEHINCGSGVNNNITINGVSINTPSNTANTDGIDPAGTNWLIENCTISDGDDDIAPKPQNQPCANIDIENCTILAGHGISIGGQTNDGFNGFTVNNVTFNGTTNGLRLKAGEGNGGLVQNLTYSNITMTNVQNPIIIDSYYNNGDNNFPTDPTSDKGSTPDSTTPIWQNITFQNVTSTDTASNSNGGIIFGLPDEPVQNMKFINVKITANKGMEINHVRNTSFDSQSHFTITSGNDLVGETSGSSFPTPVDAQITGAGFTNADIGSPTIPFDTSRSVFDPDTGHWTINGGGAAIGGTSDSFNYSYTPVSGDSSFIAQLTGLTGPGGSAVAQAGVMYRAGTAAGDPFAAVVQTTGNQIVFEWRSTSGGSVQTATVSHTVGSVYLKITRSGSNFSAFFSADGSTYTQVGSSQAITAIGSTANAGMAVTANSNGNLATATFANVSTTGGSSNAAPTVATPASASPNPGTAKTTALSVLGADDGGESNLTYTWASSGPASVTFSANGTNAAKSSTATFSTAGAYTFTVTIKDSGGLTVTSSVNVTINQTLTSIAVTPATVTLNTGATQQFAASAKDQFGNTLSTQPTFTWAVASGVGSVSSSGLYSAGSTAGSATVRAASGSVTGTASVTVNAVNAAPTVATPASASPNPVTAKTTALSVLGADDGGESNLTYTWASSGPANVSFSANGTNASKNSTATFSAAGSYTFTVTIKDVQGLTTTSSVGVTVSQTLTSIVVSPATASITTGATQQFAASAKDQFGNTMTSQPTFTWSVASGGVGSISSSGLYTAGSTAGTATVHAVSGSVTGTASVTVTVPATTHVNLSSSFNRVGMSNDGQTFSGTGIDGSNDALSETLINASTLPGKFTIGSPGVNDVVAASGQSIALPAGNFSSLTFLGTGVNGKKPNKTFIVNYTDGTSTTFTVSLSNWNAPQNYAGETIDLTMSYYNTSTGGRTNTTVNLYQYTLTLNSAKTVSSITLPSSTNSVIILAINLNP